LTAAVFYFAGFILRIMTDKFPFEIIDSHLHVFDLKLRSSFPNQNPSHSFPSATDPGEAPIAYDVTQALAEQVAGANGVRNVIFVMCYNDCPEEARWVYEVAQSHQLIKGIVAGLDLTNHDKLLKCIDEFRSSFRGPKFVGVRHHIVSNEDLLMRYKTKHFLK
jgi:predicted TIM-barrel fold metal-dependent hydrolase